MQKRRLSPLRPGPRARAGVEPTLASKYMQDHRVSEILREVTTDLVLLQPEDAIKYMYTRLGQVIHNV
jgi:hypothetical protein